ncbi:translocation/assembly module TamB domain-containing protein [Deinococcus sp. S9]|uniref:translocation/assembly module TamB domain-containing protein n=1 Tax=Deinococcus sp. S9 TaxID=2545754 RepID=UPI001056A500|nr:translocation/assembly module TamB domain-containing protein [Deinococcus sp. S9]TDE87094.1 translocation/assembly module TamB [Deinococcus sp. S9]
MTDTPHPDLTPRARRRWPWVLLALAALLALGAWFAPTLLGQWVLQQVSGGHLRVTAQGVGGPLWAPWLQGAEVKLPGVAAAAGRAGVSVAGVDLAHRTLRLNVAVADATVDLKLKDLLTGEKGQANALSNGWNVVLNRVDVQRTRVNVDGSGVNIPNGHFLITPGEHGALAVRGQTPDGELNANVTGKAGNVFVLDLDADARVLNHYWRGVTGGRITGRYVLGSGPVRGDLKVTNASIRVPQAHFVTVRNISGTATQRGNVISLNLSGRGWDGPVAAKGGVDLQAQHWTITAEATPTVAGLARALGTTGHGNLSLRVTAGGWSTVRVKAYGKGAGTLEGIPFHDLNAEYTFLNHSGAGGAAGQTNDLSFTAQTALVGQQTLTGRWAFGRAGAARWTGTFAQKPLDVTANIDAHNVLTLAGRGLGGPLSGTFALHTQALQAILHPTYGAAQAELVLSGTPQDLRAVVTHGQAGPFALAGTARLNREGLKADLGPVTLDLDRTFRGTWTARNLAGAGLTLSGQGRVDLRGGDVAGTIAANVPGVPGTLRGPLTLNYRAQQGTFTPGNQRLTWRGDAFTLDARQLEVAGGVRLNGTATVTTRLRATGTLTATGNGFHLIATGLGDVARLRGTAGGVTVLADTQLARGLRTTARVQGAEIQGVLSLDDGVRFTLTTAGETARGVLNGQDWDVTGRVNLAALRPLIGVKDLGGTLDLALAGRGGTVRVDAAAAGATVRGTLTRTGERVQANLRAAFEGVTARLAGQVYPSVQASGTASWQGQTLNAVLSGEYGNLRARLTGRTGELSFSGVTLPGQAVNVTATLTPRLSASGTWGNLRVGYDAQTGQLAVSGQQALTVFGQAGQVRGQATWALGFRGTVNASGVLDQYTVALRGPWQNLTVRLTDREGLRAVGTAALPEGRYDLNVRGPIAGVYMDGHVTGTGLSPRGTVDVFDGAGGSARVTLRGFDHFDVRSRGLTLAGQRVAGDLTARDGVLSGDLTAGPLHLSASGGRVNAAGVVAGHTVTATGRLTLPATLEDLRVNVTGPYVRVQAQGGVANLRGTLRVQAQTFGEGATRVTLPAQTLPLIASLTGGRVTVGGLSYLAGRWSGDANLRYALAGQPSTLRLIGEGGQLAAVPAGPVMGRVTLWPTLGGTLTASLAPLRPLLPAELRAAVVPGQLVATLDPAGAALSTRGTRYLGEPLSLTARVGWTQGLTASGTLTHPGSRIPVRYDGHTLTVNGAVLDARALRPWLAATGGVTADLTVPGLDFAKANGRARVNLAAAGQRAVGSVTLARGQLGTDLTSDLAGLSLRVRGPLYPRANALLDVEGVRGTLRGNVADTLTLRAAGTYGGRSLDLTATGQALSGPEAAATLNGVVAGAYVHLRLSRADTDWRVAGTFGAPDLQALVGTAGNVSGTVTGTLRDLRLSADGEIAGAVFHAPASYAGGVLQVQGATAELPYATLRASGAAFPTLTLSAKATLTDYLPGTYTVQARGSLSKPDLTAQGRLTGAAAGLQASGTRLTARLLGQDWKLNFSGEALAGFARGQLGSGALAGLQDSRLNVHAPLISGDTQVRLDGVTGWNARRGWLGSLRATGNVPGGALDATLQGAGTLALAGSIGPASVAGTFPADLPLKPGGTLDLTALDVGALWGRAGELRATGRTTLAGASWSRLEASFAGRLADTGGDLTGALDATYRAGDVALRLAGARLTGDATLSGGRYQAVLKAEPVHLARLFPPRWDVDALTFAGTVRTSGTLAQGPARVEVQNLALRGEQGAAGPFSLYGRATYLRGDGQPGMLEADLSGSLRGGLLQAHGALPAGVRVTARNVDARAFGAGLVHADLALSGPLDNVLINGNASAVAPDFDARVAISGPLRDARANARVTLQGQGRAGLLYADASKLDLAAGRVQARVYGTARQGDNTLRLDLRGVWPRLTGSATATLSGLPSPVRLTGDGQGSYALEAGTLGAGRLTLTPSQGFIPALAGQLHLTPLALLAGSGTATADLTLAGTLTAPRLAGTLTTRGAEVAGVSLADTTGAFTGTLGELRGTLTQAGMTVATLKGQTVTLSGLTANAAGSSLRANGTAKLSGTADLTLTAAGVLNGNLRARYQARALALSGTLSGQGLRAALDVNADPFTGWHGTARVTGGPEGVLTEAADLKFSGSLAHPLVTGEAGLLGAGARLVANTDGVQLRLVDGPAATASGVLELRPDERGEWRWLGTAALTRPELSLSLTPTGLLAEPNVTLSLRRGEWRAAGTASLKAADLDVTDGLTAGHITWNGEILRADLPGLDLARLDLPHVTGQLTASGTLSSATQDGHVSLRGTKITTAYAVPYLGVTLAGDLTADVTLSGGKLRVQASAALPSGVVRVNASQGASGWTGNLTGTLARENGTLTANVVSGPGGLTGAITAARYPLSALGQDVQLEGTVTLGGQTFQANLTAGNDMGAAQLSGRGGLADLLPALGSLTAVRPTEEGYRLHALLDNVEVAKLNIATSLAGRVSGEANIQDGGGTVVISSPALQIGPKQLGARVEGTLVGGDWRIRGFLGETDFFASLTGGTLNGRATLQALPVGAVIAAFTGTPVGEGVVTGVARFSVPLADPLAGNATVVAERIRVTATSGTGAQAVTETLMGTGTLDYAARELRNVNIQLAGAGTWDVHGGYTRQRVDLSAQFRDTTFTPVLRLIPGLAELTPSLKGSVTLTAAGTYDRPRGLLRAQNLVGSVAGLSLQIPNFAGDLPDSGAFTAGGRVLTGGTVGSDGTVDVRGQLTLGKLSGTRVTFSGLLAPQALGALPGTTVTLLQAAGNRWTLEAQSRSAATATTPAGSLRVTGTVAPRPDLTLTARTYNLPLAAISARESVLNADLRAVDDGQLIHVNGTATFLRLVLGRTNAPMTIPAPGQSSVDGSSAGGRTTDNYPSPLPPEYTTFPQPETDKAEAGPAQPLLQRVVFEDIPIQAPNGIRVDEALARAEFSGNLVLSGTGARPQLRGEVIAQRGTLYLRENEFTLRSGRVTFAGEGILPTFAALASGTVPAATTGQRVPVSLDVQGEFRPAASGQNVLELHTTLSCTATAGNACTDPVTGNPYTEAQLYALVATGVPDLQALPENLAALGTSALQTALNVFVLGEIERNVARALGLDVFRFTPNLATADGSLGATLTLGSYLTRDLYLQYQVDLNGKGLLDATYSTPDGRVTFKVSTPLDGLNLESVRPSFSAAYNFTPRTSVSLGVQNDEDSTKIRFGVTYRLFAR